MRAEAGTLRTHFPALHGNTYLLPAVLILLEVHHPYVQEHRGIDGQAAGMARPVLVRNLQEEELQASAGHPACSLPLEQRPAHGGQGECRPWALQQLTDWISLQSTTKELISASADNWHNTGPLLPARAGVVCTGNCDQNH